MIEDTVEPMFVQKNADGVLTHYDHQDGKYTVDLQPQLEEEGRVQLEPEEAIRFNLGHELPDKYWQNQNPPAIGIEGEGNDLVLIIYRNK